MQKEKHILEWGTTYSYKIHLEHL